MHDPFVLGREDESGVLVHGQRVDIGTQTDLRSIMLSLDLTDHTGVKRVVQHRDAV